MQVGYAPSPNLKAVSSKIGSLANANYKPGGGNVKIESRKIQIEAKPRIGARNENYQPSGGDVKVNWVFIFPIWEKKEHHRHYFRSEHVFLNQIELRPISAIWSGRDAI